MFEFSQPSMHPLWHQYVQYTHINLHLHNLSHHHNRLHLHRILISSHLQPHSRLYLHSHLHLHNHLPVTAYNTLSARQQRRRRATEKPIAILAYNKGKSGIDKSDQMASYATSLRKGVKWYRKLAIELLLGVAVVNARNLYGKASQKKIKIRRFKKELADSLLKLSSNNSEQLRSPCMKLSATHHLITRVNAAGKPMRRYCSSCYKNVKEEKGRKVARKTGKQTNTFCDGCTGQPQMCLPCFNALNQQRFLLLSTILKAL